MWGLFLFMWIFNEISRKIGWLNPVFSLYSEPFFAYKVVKHKKIQTNHSENGCVLQKSVLGIVKTVYFSKKMYLVLCGQLFLQSSKNLATLPVIIEPLFTESNKNSIGKQHKNWAYSENDKPSVYISEKEKEQWLRFMGEVRFKTVVELVVLRLFLCRI